MSDIAGAKLPKFLNNNVTRDIESPTCLWALEVAWNFRIMVFASHLVCLPWLLDYSRNKDKRQIHVATLPFLLDFFVK